MTIDKRIIWITQSALFLALVVAAQAGTAFLGNQFVTGSLVNLVLILAVMLCGLAQGLTVAALSPVFAKLLGIGPLWELIPFISAGNAVIVTVWFFIGNLKLFEKKETIGAGDAQAPQPESNAARGELRRAAFHVAALILGASAKFLFLYLTIARLAVPYLLNLPEKQAAAVSGTFSLPQLLTAALGGAAAVILIPLIKRAIKTRRT